jgi:hypothetical protein
VRYERTQRFIFSATGTAVYAQGVSGPLFDWIRAVYADMRYATRLHGEFSELFASDVGLMTGGTGSPGFFLVYSSAKSHVAGGLAVLAQLASSIYPPARQPILASSPARQLQAPLYVTCFIITSVLQVQISKDEFVAMVVRI